MARQLLISVRNIDEAKLVAAAGVSIIDFKEPSFGALAPVDPAIWQAAAEHFPSLILSAALGESETGIGMAAKVPPTFQFAKIGPSGCETGSSLMRLWRQVQLPSTVELVPVAYADFQNARTLPPLDLLRCAIDSGATRCLIDTFTKDGRGLLQHCNTDQLADFQNLARQTNTWWALAGSLKLAELGLLEQAGIQPNCVGVRGDVCVATDQNSRRTGIIDPDRVAAWVQARVLCRE